MPVDLTVYAANVLTAFELQLRTHGWPEARRQAALAVLQMALQEATEIQQLRERIAARPDSAR